MQKQQYAFIPTEFESIWIGAKQESEGTRSGKVTGENRNQMQLNSNVFIVERANIKQVLNYGKLTNHVAKRLTRQK